VLARGVGAQPARLATDWSAIEGVVRAAMESRGIPGVVVVVANNRRVVWSNAFGVADVVTGAPLTTAHLLQVGSITKTFTALLALQLSTRGELPLDQPIGNDLPTLPPRLAALTLRDLLHQRAGLADMPGDDGPDDEGELARHAASLGDTLQVLPAGTAFSYSNAGYALAGAAIEAHMRRPFAELMRQYVFGPAGMRSSTMRPAEATQLPHATGHVGPSGARATAAPSIANDTRLWPAGYAWSSGDDLGRFLVALLAEGGTTTGGGWYRGVSDSALVSVIAVPGLPGGARYGMGAFLDRSDYGVRAWHPGNVTGFSALWRAIPSRNVGVAVLSNRDGVRLDAIADSVLEAVIAGLPTSRQGAGATRGTPRANERPRPNRVAPRNQDARTPDAISSVPESLGRSLAGTYVGRFPIELRWHAGRLELVRFGDTLPVSALGGDRYSVDPPGDTPAESFTIVPAASDRPAYVQMFLWAFVRR